MFIKAIAENDSGDIEIAMQLLIEQTKKINELKAKGLMNSEMLQEIVINAPKKREIETKYAKDLAKKRKALAKKISIAALVIGAIALTALLISKKKNS